MLKSSLKVDYKHMVSQKLTFLYAEIVSKHFEISRNKHIVSDILFILYAECLINEVLKTDRIL